MLTLGRLLSDIRSGAGNTEMSVIRLSFKLCLIPKMLTWLQWADARQTIEVAGAPALRASVDSFDIVGWRIACWSLVVASTAATTEVVVSRE